MPGEPDRQSRNAPWWPTAALLALFAAAAIPLILAGGVPGRAGSDHYNYHEPAIRRFAQEWPSPDLSNYLSATTPLYHLTLAGFARYVADSTAGLRLVSALFTVGLLAVFSRACARRLPHQPGLVLALCLPLAASLHVFPPGVWLLPDNAGWLGVLAIWLIALSPSWTWPRLALASGLLVMLVLTRQIHVWSAALVWTAAWLSDDRTAVGSDRGPLIPVGPLLRPTPARLRRAAAALLLTLPAFAVVGVFVSIWGGLVVPRYQGMYRGWSGATPAFALSLLACYSAFFAGWLAPGLMDALRRRRTPLLAAAAIGLTAAVLPVTTYSLGDGRFGGLWYLVDYFADRLPVIGGRTSVIFLVLAPIGAAALVLWLDALPIRTRLIMLAAFVAFEAAQTTSLPWQRYHEPMLLMWVALAAACARRGERTVGFELAVARGVGPIVLATFFAGITAGSIWAGDDASAQARDPLASPHYRGPPAPPPREYTEGPLGP
ncbi:MAG: hypothetical protein ACKVU4_06420 [Phycisphaerales bacterium]